MAELEIDQSHLPRVEDVRQNFAVLEDGVLAHSLQEQEIEQYYMTNIQKNQLVQNDIRVAKRLQEEEQRAQHSALLRQTSRQIEEQDFVYARVIQEQIQRRAEEARRREMDDEELAKQIQEEEEQRLRRSREAAASSSGSDPPSSHRHAHSRPPSQAHDSPFSNRGRRSPSDWQCTSPQADSPRGLRTNPRLRSSEGHSFRDSEERLSEESEGSDTVFPEHTSVRARTLPPQRQARDRNLNLRSLVSHRSFPEYCNNHLEENYNENCESSRTRNDNKRDYRPDYDRNKGLESELADVSERCKRTESARLPDRRRQSFREAAKTWAYRDNPDRRVHFREDSAKSNGRREVWEMLGQVLRERGVPVRLSNSSGAPLQIGAAQRRESRDRQTLYGSKASCDDAQPHQRAFQRAVTARHSFHGDFRERRCKDFNREPIQGQDYEPVQPAREIRRRDSNSSRERQGSRRWKERKCMRDDESDANEHQFTRTSERRPADSDTQRSSEELELGRPRRRAPNRSQSLSSSSSRALRSRHAPSTERDRTSLELGELQQVLHDEELARKLQEDEERVLNRNPRPSPHISCPEGDFKVAQVAQDEEIARYMQKQEMKSKRRSRELEGPVSWREHRTMMSQHDRRVRERQVPRERLDSEGLPSPTEDCSPEDQPHGPGSTLPTVSQIRNIAEELDPTFHVRRPGSESLRGAQTGGPCCAPLPAPQSGFVEEPTFIPPTKRQAEKSVRPKSKEKRENCKQQ